LARSDNSSGSVDHVRRMKQLIFFNFGGGLGLTILGDL
jgi:hypothetical protein